MYTHSSLCSFGSADAQILSVNVRRASNVMAGDSYHLWLLISKYVLLTLSIGSIDDNLQNYEQHFTHI